MDKLKLTGLWKNTDKSGNTYLSGSISPIAGVVIMPNTFKKDGEKGPDYYLYLTPKDETKKTPPPKDTF